LALAFTLDRGRARFGRSNRLVSRPPRSRAIERGLRAPRPAAAGSVDIGTHWSARDLHLDPQSKFNDAITVLSTRVANWFGKPRDRSWNRIRGVRTTRSGRRPALRKATGSA